MAFVKIITSEDIYGTKEDVLNTLKQRLLEHDISQLAFRAISSDDTRYHAEISYKVNK